MTSMSNDITMPLSESESAIIAWMRGEAAIQARPTGSDCKWNTVTYKANYTYRIKPEQFKYRVALMQTTHNPRPITVTALSVMEAAGLATAEGFVRWLTDWVEVEL